MKEQQDSDILHEGLQRDLKERHVQLIGIGGAIGVGLFLGSASAIKAAGPSIVLAYGLGGIFIYFILRALGELTVEQPISGSFTAYAYQFIGPLAGYLTGWSYWLFWALVCMLETTATGIYVQFWWPDMPQWISALACTVFLTAANLASVKVFGEFEFWFALIKVLAIIAMIFFGLSMILFGIGNDGIAIGFSNLWLHGGIFPNGLSGFITSLVMVAFAFLGMELIGVTAGEAENPEKTIPSAIDKVFYRVLIFYVGSLLVILSVYPWEQIGTMGSPFVLIFDRLGIPAAAGIINFVVITASLSTGNSGIYVTGRTLHSLALQGKAPKYFVKLSKSAVPHRGILASVAMMVLSVILNYFIPEEIFNYLMSVITFIGLYVWFIILWSQQCRRKKLSAEEVSKLKFPMPGYPYTNWMTILFLGFVIFAMAIDDAHRVSLIVGPLWLLILTGIYYKAGFHKKNETEVDSLSPQTDND